jgi:hypothetical protein
MKCHAKHNQNMLLQEQILNEHIKCQILTGVFFFYKCDLYCAPVAMRLHFLKEIFGFKGTLSQEKSVYSSETFSNLFDRPFQNQ